jgi:hypothetical protein
VSPPAAFPRVSTADHLVCASSWRFVVHPVVCRAVAEAAREAAEAEEAARLADDDDEDEERSVGVGLPVSMGYAPAPVPLQSYPGYAPGQPTVMQVPGRPTGGGRQQPRWRHPLPDDFLRFPGVGLPALPGQHSVETGEDTWRPTSRFYCFRHASSCKCPVTLSPPLPLPSLFNPVTCRVEWAAAHHDDGRADGR